jgi:hypothetical protein
LTLPVRSIGAALVLATAATPGLTEIVQIVPSIHAQALAPSRPPTIRGTVVAIEQSHLRVATATGEMVVTLDEPLTVTGARAARLSDITPGTFVGTAARVQADGAFHALEVHIFPESMRGAGEGHRPWEQPGDHDDERECRRRRATDRRIDAHACVQGLRGPCPRPA